MQGCSKMRARKQVFKRALFGRASDHLLQQKKLRSQQQQAASCTFDCSKQKDGSTPRIGIVGGGMSGLYAALLLKDLGIDYHIFEADPQRMGGRVLTHYFEENTHQYAELGAMRFPYSELQDRLFKTWDYLNATAGSVAGAEPIERIPYILHDDTTDADAGNLLCFNGRTPVTRNQAAADNSLLGFDQYFVAPKYDYFKRNGQLKPAQEILDNALEPFLQLFENEGVNKAWLELQAYDGYSARSYLQQHGDKTQAYPSQIVDYLETVLSYTGIFDLAFIELVLDQFSFAETEDWYAMDGGTARITDELVNRIPADKITQGAKVFKLSEEGDQAVIHYRCAESGDAVTEYFDRVIETLPFSLLRFIDTPQSWSAGKYSAMRMLKMTNATKISLGFSERFWQQDGEYSKQMRGGQSDTDLPVRSVVYPSFGLDDAGPGYLLASYCWQNDADKFSHMTDDQLKEAALESVVHLHGEVARQTYLGKGASVVWNREQYAGGAFEFFAAGQFGDMFHAACEPEGRFHFAGEHLDMVHYWIAGSFDSAFRTVWEVLILQNMLTKENWDTLRSSMGGGEIFPSMVPSILLRESEAAESNEVMAEMLN